MWPFGKNKEQRVLEAAHHTFLIVDAFMSPWRPHDQLLSAMMTDPYVAGYVFTRFQGAALDVCRQNKIPTSAHHSVQDMAMAKFLDGRPQRSDGTRAATMPQHFTVF